MDRWELRAALAQALKERDEALAAREAEHVLFVLLDGIGKACEKMREERDEARDLGRQAAADWEAACNAGNEARRELTALRAALEPTKENVRWLAGMLVDNSNPDTQLPHHQQRAQAILAAIAARADGEG